MGSFVISRKLIFAWKFLKIYYLIGLMIPAYGMLIPILQMFTRFRLRDQYFPMILLYAGINFPMSFFLITNYIDGLSREIDEAAAIDGCSVFGTVFRIIFPIAKPGIFTAAIVSFFAVYNELIFANTLLQIKTMQTISVSLLGLRGERFTSWGPMFASIVLSIAPIMVVYILFQNRVESGITAGAVKG
jgi:raffinose/stachyose/melibiose transport system permease protein